MNGRNKPPSLFYSPALNRFADEQWYIVHNLNRLFSTWELDQWKRNRRNGTLMDRKGTIWNLYYLDEDEESDIFENIDWNESFGMKMDRTDY